MMASTKQHPRRPTLIRWRRPLHDKRGSLPNTTTVRFFVAGLFAAHSSFSTPAAASSLCLGGALEISTAADYAASVFAIDVDLSLIHI